MKLTFTNAFGNKETPKSAEIDIQNCKITNYDTRTHIPSGAGDLTIDIGENDATVTKGSSNINPDGKNKVNFNAKKYSIFTALASCDGDNSTLTEKDLSEAKNNSSKWEMLKNLGATGIRYDANTGVATITIGDNEILRIDFETKEKKEAKENRVVTPQDVEEIISNFKGGAINIDKVKDIKSVAKYTGLSESYIKDVLVGIEGHNNWPLLTSKYDGVADSKHPKGYLTIGFGHTSLTGEPEVVKNMQITEKQAYQILANDIINAIKYTNNKLNKLCKDTKIPASIKDAIVDMVFNKGPKAINENLIANLNKGYYSAAAVRTWYDTPEVGLQKRNMYRFLAAIKDLDKQNKTIAVKKFRSEHENQLLKVFKKDNDAKVAWNNMCNEFQTLKEYQF